MPQLISNTDFGWHKELSLSSLYEEEWLVPQPKFITFAHVQAGLQKIGPVGPIQNTVVQCIKLQGNRCGPGRRHLNIRGL